MLSVSISVPLYYIIAPQPNLVTLERKNPQIFFRGFPPSCLILDGELVVFRIGTQLFVVVLIHRSVQFIDDRRSHQDRTLEQKFAVLVETQCLLTQHKRLEGQHDELGFDGQGCSVTLDSFIHTLYNRLTPQGSYEYLQKKYFIFMELLLGIFSKNPQIALRI